MKTKVIECFCCEYNLFTFYVGTDTKERGSDTVLLFSGVCVDELKRPSDERPLHDTISFRSLICIFSSYFVLYLKSGRGSKTKFSHFDQIWAKCMKAMEPEHIKLLEEIY